MDPYKAYCRYYQAQSGGEIPVFRGGFQSGEGVGDYLHGLLRSIVPIAMKGVSAFAGNMYENHNKGSSLKDSALAALKPTLSAVAGSIADQLQEKEQAGSGFSRLKRSASHAFGLGKRADVYKKRKVKRNPNGQFTGEKHQHLNF